MEDFEDWCVDDHRGSHETDEHWELRRNFLVKNKDRFPKYRLLSLSQVFSNMEFLGCRYPEETMDLVAELSVGIIEEYRKKRESRLQRTFVKASDAAERKTKGIKRPQSSTSAISNKIFVSGSNESETPHHEFSNVTQNDNPAGASVWSQQGSSRQTQELSPKCLDLLKGLVIVKQPYLQGESPLQILNRSFAMCHKPPLKFTLSPCGQMYMAVVEAGELELCRFQGFGKDATKQLAAKKLLDMLTNTFYTIEIKASIYSPTEYSKSDIKDTKDTSGGTSMSENSIGIKLLKMMDWQGRGLGKDEQGTETPVGCEDVVKRTRLGIGATSHEKEFTVAIRNFIQQQMWQCEEVDLKFSNEFSSDERRIIHQVANQIGLKSRSYGKGEHRYLVISKKIQLEQLVEEILHNGETAKYKVVPPSVSSQEVPITKNGAS